MRLAATLTKLGTERGSPRQTVNLRGTLRDADDAPSEIVILDVSESGFLAELPASAALALDTRVRVAATMLGAHEAVVVRRDGALHGFAFARPLGPDAVIGLDGEQTSSVTRFPGVSLPVPPQADVVMPGRLSARASLGIMIAIALGLWLSLAAVVVGVLLLG